MQPKPFPDDDVADTFRHARKQQVRQTFQGFLLSFLLTLPFLWQIGAMINGYVVKLPPWVQALLATFIQIKGGWPLYRGAYRSFSKMLQFRKRSNDLEAKKGNTALLIVLGTTVAYGFSLIVYLFGLPYYLYFEVSAVILTLVLLGRWLEALNQDKVAESLEKLLQIQPTTALIEKNEQWKEIPIESVVIDDIFLVHPNHVIPMDGIVLEGQSAVNESMLTGESQPTIKTPGSKLLAGTFNENGLLKVKSTRVASQTVLSAIMKFVEKAQSSQTDIHQLIQHLSTIFIFFTLGSSLATFLTWIFLGASYATGLINAIAVIIIACPCALSLAVPTVMMVTHALSAQHGILFGGNSFPIAMSNDFDTEIVQLTNIRNALDLSQAAKKKIQQNLFFAFVYNVLGIPLAAAGLLNPYIATGTMGMSFFSVIANALLLRYWRPRKP